jgi:Ferritin-like domain
MKPQNSTIAYRASRRSILKGTIAGVAATGFALTHLDASNTAHAQNIGDDDDHYYTSNDYNSYRQHWNQNGANKAIAKILNIAITAEELAVVFYSHVLKNTGALGFGPNAVGDIRAALFEEQVHQLFLAKQGAKALTHTFSFPFGQNTFNNFDNFFKVQQQLEAAFVAAYLAAGKEFTNLRRPDLVQIAAQIGGTEAEHRAIGRVIGAKRPANNRVFETVLLKAVGDAPAFLKNNGYLSPKDGNSFTFQPIDMDYTGLSGRSYGDQDWD